MTQGFNTSSILKTIYHSISTTAFSGKTPTDTTTLHKEARYAQNLDGGFASRQYEAEVNLPQGAIVTSFKMYYKRFDAASAMSANLRISTFAGTGAASMASVAATDATGNISSIEDTTITSATIDNAGNTYCIELTINNNNSINDVFCYGFLIAYTVKE